MYPGVVELCLFRLKPGHGIEEFTHAADEATAFLTRQPGFVRRVLSHAPQEDQWADIVFWDTPEEARRAAEAFAEAGDCRRFIAMIDPTSLAMHHMHPRLEF